MSIRRKLASSLAALSLAAAVPAGSAEAPKAVSAAAAKAETVRLYAGAAPGTEDWTGDETSFPYDGPTFGKLTLVSNVTVPTLTVIRPAPGKSNGTAVVVIPGGGFQFLSWEHEGLEVGQWLANRGVTAFVLKYRVRMTKDMGAITAKPPANSFSGRLKEADAMIRIAREDAFQAVRTIRANAGKYGIASDRVGMIGFSAGAITTMSVLQYGDAASRPDFAAPIYGGMDKPPAAENMPPLFIAHTRGDALVPSSEATRIYSAWNDAGRSVELHIYDKGPHGFGMRKAGLPVDKWTDAFAEWLGSNGWLEPKKN